MLKGTARCQSISAPQLWDERRLLKNVVPGTVVVSPTINVLGGLLAESSKAPVSVSDLQRHKGLRNVAVGTTGHPSQLPARCLFAAAESRPLTGAW